jgi:protocatechuate 3,4-dioxygenase beta subunit
VFSVRIALGWRLAARLRRSAAATVSSEWQKALQELMVRMRVSAPVSLLASSRTTVPAVVGWLRPVVLMPVEALTGLPISQVRALLAHELAHVLRHDYLVNVLQSMAEALLFYHPAVWWVSNQIRAEREMCCDDLAVEASGDALAFAVALAGLDSHRRARLRAAQTANGGSLLHRIRRLAGEAELPGHSLPGVGAVSALAVLWMAGLGVAALHASPASARVALRSFVPPGVVAAPPALLDPPPAIRVPRVPPMLGALLFDPFFAPPQAPASAAQNAPDAVKPASLAGTVTSDSGTVVAHATVTLMPVPAALSAPPGPSATTAITTIPMPVASSGPPAASRATARTTQTDASGDFLFDNLAPGQYRLGAMHPKYLRAIFGASGNLNAGATLSLAAGQTLTAVNLTLIEPGSISGRVVDEDGDPVTNIDVRVLEFIHYNGRRVSSTVARASSGDNGQFKVERVRPGAYILRMDTQPTWRGDERAPVPSLKPGQKDIRPHCSYFGGTHDEGTATPIAVARGIDLPLGNIKILNRVMIHVRGHVRGDPALLEGARVVRMPGTPTSGSAWSYGADIAKDGSFDMANLWQDTFAIEVLKMGQMAPLGWARVVTGEEDLENVLIDAEPGPLHGVVKLEEEAQPTTATAGAAPPPKPQGRIQLRAAGIPELMQLTAAISSDGSFTIPLVPPGRYLADVIGLPQGSYVKSARYNTIDALEQGLDWGNDQKGTLEVVISAKAATLSGTVQDDDGKPAPGSIVTLVPDPVRPPVARLYPTAKADDQGMFQFQSVTPGTYRVYAWQEIGSTAHWDPDFIRPFTGSSERVDLEEGGSGSVKLTWITAAKMHEALRRAGLCCTQTSY